MSEKSEMPTPPRYRWPWFVLALFLLGLVLVIVWVGLEARRLREYRSDSPANPASTQSPAPLSATNPPNAR
jgi:hypothetical protein